MRLLHKILASRRWYISTYGLVQGEVLFSRDLCRIIFWPSLIVLVLLSLILNVI